jgi:23S rRNA (uracil1939-C5)-methyltransferase
VGFFARASQELVDVKRCPIAQPAIDRLAAPTAAAARDPVPAGPWEVEWVSDGKGGAVGLLVADFAGALAGALAALPGVSGLAVRRRSGHAWTAVAGATRVSWTTAGPQGPIRLESEARDFSQANAGLNPALVAKVLELASPHPGERTFEPYAGAGNLTIPLLLAGADVTSAEIAREAVADARAAADALGLRGTFLAGDATAHARRLAARGERFDLLVADPPRTGLSDPAALAGLAASRIVLVSCEPSALARDVASLASAGYRLDRLALVDMFPQTFHVEAVARLERR